MPEDNGEPARQSQSVRDPFIDRQYRLLADVRRLLDFAVSQAVVRIDNPFIAKVVRATAVVRPVSAEQEAELWQVYNSLSDLVHPATANSVLAINELNADQQKRPSMVRKWRHDPIVRRLIRSSIVWVLIALVPLVFLQWYSLSLSSALDGIVTSENQLQTSKIELSRIEQAMAEAKPPPPSLDKQRDFWDERVRLNEDEVTAGYSLLRGLPFVTWLTPSTSTDANKKEEEARRQLINSRHMSETLLKALSHYVVPLLYGLIGANVYILRQLISQLDGWKLNAISVSRYHLRRVLGVLLGAIVGLTFDSNESAVVSVGFGLATLAFLAGYSAEFVFSILDAIIDRAKEAFTSQPKYQPQQRDRNSTENAPRGVQDASAPNPPPRASGGVSDKSPSIPDNPGFPPVSAGPAPSLGPVITASSPASPSAGP